MAFKSANLVLVCTTLVMVLMQFPGCSVPPTPSDWRYYDPSTDEVNIGRRKGTNIQAKELAQRYAQACEADSGPACHRLGTLHVGGIGVARNEDQAKTLFKRSCELGDDRGCFAVKHGPNRQDTRYLPVMGSWCDEGRVEGCVRLAIAFEEGEPRQHIHVDLKRAVELYRDACALEHRPSCEHMVAVARTIDKEEPPRP